MSPDPGAGDHEIGGLPGDPPCPFCSTRETELMNAFGSHASVSTYWCRRCRSPFEVLKWRTGAGIVEPSGPQPSPHPTDEGSP
jgi:hypothetical protein